VKCINRVKPSLKSVKSKTADGSLRLGIRSSVLGFSEKNNKNIRAIRLPRKEVYPVKCEAIFNRE